MVNYDNVQTFAAVAAKIGATGVAIRTDNNLAEALGVFHARGIKVYGWRWPFAQRDDAMREADKVASAFHYGQAAAQRNIRQLHFYTHDKHVAPAVWDAIAAL